MRSFKSIFLIVALLSFGISHGQSVERSVVCTGGDYLSVGNLSLEFTLGEVAIGQYSTSGLILSQGFNQSDTTTATSSIEEKVNQAYLSLYPNPSSDNITVSSEKAGSISILDMTGKVWYSGIECEAFQPLQIKVMALKAGVYFLRLKTSTGYSIVRWVKV